MVTVRLSAPEPKAQVHYCDHSLSVVRPSSLTFHNFDFSYEAKYNHSTILSHCFLNTNLIVLFWSSFMIPTCPMGFREKV